MNKPDGVKLIAAERIRQVEGEGYTTEMDDKHEAGELATAAVCYASPGQVFEKIDLVGGGFQFTDPWPWANEWDKRRWDEKLCAPKPNSKLPVAERIRNLVKAGALIAAEIDRLQRTQSHRSRKEE